MKFLGSHRSCGADEAALVIGLVGENVKPAADTLAEAGGVPNPRSGGS